MINVDVILICYNQERYIRDAIDSIFRQRVSNDVQLHLIVADDCSVDNTLRIIHNAVDFWQKERDVFSHIEFLPSDFNVGISRNYQRAFAACDGDYILVMEGDDYWLNDNHIQQHVDFLFKHKECSMAMNRITYGYSNGTQEVDKWNSKCEFEMFTLRDQIVWCNVLGNMSACSLRTDCIKRLPKEMFDLHVDDFLLGVMMAQQGSIGVMQESTSLYRCNGQSMWASLSFRKRFKRNLYYAKVYDELQDGKYHDLWKECRKRLKKQEQKRLAHKYCYWILNWIRKK